LLLPAIAVACSGAADATQGGGDGSTSAPGATTTTAESPPADGGSGSGGDNTGGGSGQIHIEIGGPVQATVDQPFFAFGSRFDGSEAGVQLNFTSEGAVGIASITGVNGTYVIGYAGDDVAANAQTCELTDWNIGDSSASGSFDCTDGFGTAPDGTYLTGITMQGSFEASP
jgi:hypothetical protein